MLQYFLFDTHALIFWNTKVGVSEQFVDFFDHQVNSGNVFVSSISFWEIALLSKKGKIEIKNINQWLAELTKNTNIRIIDPTASEMIDSVQLPDIHKDPFDRLLVVQANHNNAMLVTKDVIIHNYPVRVYWI